MILDGFSAVKLKSLAMFALIYADARHGRGVLTRPDGSSYSGQFEYGVVETSGAADQRVFLYLLVGWDHEYDEDS